MRYIIIYINDLNKCFNSNVLRIILILKYNELYV